MQWQMRRKIECSSLIVVRPAEAEGQRIDASNAGCEG